jgi:hypothetical protein
MERIKIAALYSVFDGEEFLQASINQIRPHVDGVFCFFQIKGFGGEFYFGGREKVKKLFDKKLINGNVQCEFPEKDKRAKMVEFVRLLGYTHFIFIDCDELYDSNEFAKAKIEALKYKATVCKMQTYFKRPEWTIGIDNYFVPFICKISSLQYGINWFNFIVDPTRHTKEKPIEVNITMHHYSYVRKDIMRKVNNSTARSNILKSDLIDDYNNAQVGTIIKHWNKPIYETQDHFKLSEILN